MSFIDSIYEKAKANKKRIVVPECTNPSMMRAAVKAANDGLADITFVGDAEVCKKVAQENEIDLSIVTVIDVNDTVYQEELIAKYAELPRRGFSAKSVAKRITNPLYMALIMEAVGDADCTFGGLDTTTTEFVMATQGILGLAPGVASPSGMLIMEIDGYEGSQGNIFGMSDGAINTEPTADQLCGIALSCCDTYTALTGKEALCGFLSYSTDGSGNSPSVFRVREGLAKAQALRPDLKIDGEFQADAAIVERVAAKKVKRESAVAGKANILVFPDAAAANIATKLIQQFAPGHSYGPIYQGFAQPVLDCSRGDTEERIYDNVAFCSVMAAAAEK
jgi:phosphate acetyltransferase